MADDLTEFHDELRAVARTLLGKSDVLDWPALVAPGWSGFEVPSALDGADATFAETAVVLTELGRAAARTPYFGAAVLGVGVLTLLEPSDDRDALLRGVADGSSRVTAAPGFRLEGGRMRGRADFVPDALGADRLLLVAAGTGGASVVAAVPAGTPGLSVEPQPVLDPTRDFATVTADVRLDDVVVPRGDAEPERLRDRAAVALACDSLGLAEAMLETTVAYVGTREQFGRPVGSFQAVKHACADMLVRVEMSRTLVADAVRSQVENPDWVPAARAKSYVCGAAVEVAGAAMQLHGGIGYTWESGVHRYLKRAALNRSLFGSAAAHRRRLAGRYA